MKYVIFDETDAHFVNEAEAYGDTEDYGMFDDPVYWHGYAAEAEEIVDRLVKATGHRFTIRSA